MCWCTPLVLKPCRQRQAEFCKCEASQSDTARAYLKKKKKRHWIHSTSVCNPSAPIRKWEAEKGDSLMKLMGLAYTAV